MNRSINHLTHTNHNRTQNKMKIEETLENLNLQRSKVNNLVKSAKDREIDLGEFKPSFDLVEYHHLMLRSQLKSGTKTMVMTEAEHLRNAYVALICILFRRIELSKCDKPHKTILDI